MFAHPSFVYIDYNSALMKISCINTMYRYLSIVHLDCNVAVSYMSLIYIIAITNILLNIILYTMNLKNEYRLDGERALLSEIVK